jgi:hypothetical protein
MRSLRPFLRDLWALTRPYWVSEDRWPGSILLAVIVAISLFLVYLNVRLNEWNGAFFNSLQEKDEAAFWRLLWEWTVIVVIYVVAGLTRLYLNMWLRIRWRTWLTERFLGRWLAHRAYYRIQLTDRETDNPDQRGRWAPSPRPAPASGPASTRGSSSRSSPIAPPSCSPTPVARPNAWRRDSTSSTPINRQLLPRGNPRAVRRLRWSNS